MAVLRKHGGIILAERVQRAIENGDDIDFDEKVTIIGNLDINSWNLPEITSQYLGERRKLVSSSIKIINSKIEGYVDFSHSWFLKPLEFVNSDFTSHVDFSKSKLESIAFRGSVLLSEHTTGFVGTIFFKDAIFSGVSFKAVDFERAKFYAMAKFDGSNFAFAQFDNCEFYGLTSFTHAQFDEIAFFSDTKFINLSDSSGYVPSTDFSNVVFAKGVHFDEAKFEKDICFTWAKFISDNPRFEAAYFVGAKFKGTATFWETIFDGTAHFGSTFFSYDVDFKLAKFMDDVDFGGAIFHGHAKFIGARFYESAYFYNTIFWKNFILTRARAYEIRLRDAHFCGSKCVSLTPQEIIDEIHWLEMKAACPWDEKCSWVKANLWSSSCILLDDSGISHLFVRWDKIKNHIAYNSSAYLELVKIFKDSGQNLEADSCYYQYRNISQQRKSWNLSKFSDLFEDFYYGYGVYPFKALYIWLLIVIIAAVVFFLGNAVYDLNSFYLSLYNSSLIFTSNAKSIKWEHWYLNLFSLLEGLLGWLLMALFLVTLGRNRPR